MFLCSEDHVLMAEETIAKKHEQKKSRERGMFDGIQQKHHTFQAVPNVQATNELELQTAPSSHQS